jgi:hypothetical protein
MKPTALALLAACAVSLPLSVARAQETTAPATGAASAKDHYDRGMIFYNVQDWPSAVRELRAAYEADPKPEYLYSLAQAQRLSGDCASAILTYRAFMRGEGGGRGRGVCARLRGSGQVSAGGRRAEGGSRAFAAGRRAATRGCPGRSPSSASAPTVEEHDVDRRSPRRHARRDRPRGRRRGHRVLHPGELEPLFRHERPHGRELGLRWNHRKDR